jgi:hypothetical protein
MGTLIDTRQLFADRAPWHGYGTDDLRHGIHVYDKADLLRRAIVQYNAKHSIAWLAYDIDTPTARFDWSDRNSPPPNLLILNRANGHGHLLYGLEAPVHDYSEAKDKPRRYLAAVDVALTEELGADPRYSKLLCKNPLHDRWETESPRVRLYDLDELASWLDLSGLTDRRRRLPAVGLGRNCSLFEDLRRWAYRARREPFLSEEMFRETVLHHAYALNGEFTPPLPHAEVRSVAKSVSRWTWRRMSDEGFRAWGDARRAKSIAMKRQSAAELRETIVRTAQECPGLTHEDIAALCGVHRVTVTRHLSASRIVARVISDKSSLPGSFNPGAGSKIGGLEE